MARAPPALAQESSSDPIGGDRARWYRADQLYVVPSEDEWAVALQGDVRVIVGDALVLADGAVVWFQPGKEPGAERPDERDEEKKGARLDPENAPFRAIYAEGHVRISLYGAIFEAESIIWDVERGEVRLWGTVIRVPPGLTRAALDPAERDRILQGFGTRGTDSPDQQQVVQDRVPAVVLRAERARVRDMITKGGGGGLFDVGTLEAEELLLTTCPYGEPHWGVGADRTRITRAADEPDAASRPPPDPRAAAAGGGSDRALRLEVESTRGDRIIESEGLAIRLGLIEVIPDLRIPLPDVPPFSYFNTAWLPHIPRVRVGASSEFGPFVLTDFRLPEISLYAPGQTFKTRYTAELDYYGDRGPAGGLDMVLNSWGELGTFDTLVDSYYVHDHGEDVEDFRHVPHHDRSRVVFLHRHRDLPLGVLLDAEVHYLSDDAFLTEYFERQSKNEKPPESYVHLRRNDESHAVQGTYRWRMNRFDADNLGGLTYVEQLPRLLYQLVPIPLFGEPVTDGTFYLSTRIELANLRKRVRRSTPSRLPAGTFPPSSAGADDQDRSMRADGLAELTWATHLGPLRVKADAGGQATFYERRRDPQNGLNRIVTVGGTTFVNQRDEGFGVDAIQRFAGFGRVSLSTDIWRAFRYENETLDWHGIRHVITPTIGYENFYRVTKDPDELIQFDATDAIRETEFFFVNLRNRLQTRRLDGVLDVVDLELEGRYFPHAGDEFTRRSFDVISADLRLRPDRWITGRVKADYDPDDGRLRQSDASISVALLDRIRLSVFHSFVDGDARGVVGPGVIPAGFGLATASSFGQDTSALGYDLAARLTDKWSLRLFQQYDFATGDFIQHRVTLRRKIHTFILDLNFSIDGGEDDDFSFSVAFMPEWLLGRGDAFGSDDRISDLSY